MAVATGAGTEGVGTGGAAPAAGGRVAFTAHPRNRFLATGSFFLFTYCKKMVYTEGTFLIGNILFSTVSTSNFNDSVSYP